MNWMIKASQVKNENVFNLSAYRTFVSEFGRIEPKSDKPKIKTDRQRVAEVQKKQFDKYR